MANKTSQHILNTSANLLGFCLFVITSLHISNYSANSIIDEFTSLVALLLVFSCLFSFFSIQTSNEIWAKRTEKTADYLFAFALIGILLIVLLVAFNFIK
jgi:hypothetical protein